MNAAEALRAERDGPILAVTLDPDMGVGGFDGVKDLPSRTVDSTARAPPSDRLLSGGSDRTGRPAHRCHAGVMSIRPNRPRWKRRDAGRKSPISSGRVYPPRPTETSEGYS